MAQESDKIFQERVCWKLLARQSFSFFVMDGREIVEVEMPSFDPADKIFSDAFAEVDKNGSGALDKKEFREFMVQANQGKISKYLFNIIDKDHSGKVTLDEFLAFGRAMYQFVTAGDVTSYARMIFEACDKDKNGQLSMSEFCKFMKYTGNDVSVFKRKKTFKQWDSDGNGTIDFDEVVKRMEFQAKQGC